MGWQDAPIIGEGSGGWESAPLIEDAAKPKPIGKDANADFLKAELEAADPFTRNLAAFGTAASNTWEGLKQWFGAEDKGRIADNKVIAAASPVSAFAGEAALTAIPFGVAAKTLQGAAKAGALIGAAQPVDGDGLEMLANKGKTIAMDAALGAGGQKVADWAGDWLAKRGKDLRWNQIKNAPRDDVVRAAQAEGLVIPPSSVDPGGWNAIRESFGGKIATAQEASNRNAPVFEKLAARAIGVSEDVPLTVEAARAVRQRAYETGYRPIADLPAVNWDPEFVRGVAALSPASAGGAVKNAGQDAIEDIVSRLANRGQWTGKQLLFDIRSLREQAKGNFNSAARAGGDAEKEALARAQSEAAKLLEGLAERNIVRQGGSPEAVSAMRSAREVIAKSHDVENALTRGGGQLDAGYFAGRKQKGKKLSGELELIADFGSYFPKASRSPAEIAGPGVSKLNAVLSVLGAGGGHLTGGPVLGAAGAVAPFVVPPMARKQMLGKRSQNRLLEMYKLGLLPRAGVGALQQAPIGFTVAGSNTFFE